MAAHPLVILAVVVVFLVAAVCLARRIRRALRGLFQRRANVARSA